MRIPVSAFLVLLCGAAFGPQARADVVVPIETVEQHVNIRFAPDAASEIVGRLMRGTGLPHVRSVEGWHEVELDGGGTGYVSADWAVIVAAAPPVEAHASADTPPAAVANEPAADDAPAARPEAEADAVRDAVPGEAAPPPQSGPVAEAAPQAVPGELAGPGVDATASPETELPVAAVAGGIEGSVDYLVKFVAPDEGGSSQIFDDGRNIGIGTNAPKQRLEVNGNIQIHERNSNVAGLMITQASGETGYIMHNLASTLTIGAGSVDRITIDRNGNAGFGVSRPKHPIETASGAHVTAGGAWTNSSSRAGKENVRELSPDDALAAVAGLKPVRFRYRNEAGEEYLGFIAEDVPELVASSDRSSLGAMDIVAALTSVVQQQQARIAALEARLDRDPAAAGRD